MACLVTESDVLDSKGDDVLCGGPRAGVFSYPEEKIESDVAEVGCGL